MLGKLITPSRDLLFKMMSSVAGSRLAAPAPSGYPAFPGIGASVSVIGVQMAKAKDALMRSYPKDWKSTDIEGKVTGNQPKINVGSIDQLAPKPWS